MKRNPVLRAYQIALLFWIIPLGLQGGQEFRQNLNLAGTWRLQLDPDNVGLAENWQSKTFTDSVRLPGTLDINKKGTLNRDTTDAHLNREYVFIGPSWYQKEVDIPTDWTDKHVVLVMERTKVTQVWLDGLDLGTSRVLFTPQVYDLTGKLTPGSHQLTVRVDNNPDLVPVAGSHAYSEDTQTNWNGIIGMLCLEASNPVRIQEIQTYPDVAAQTVNVRIRLLNPCMALGSVSIKLKADVWNSSTPHNVPELALDVALSSADTVVHAAYLLGEGVQFWSEFNPALYKLSVMLSSDGQMIDSLSSDFGMREFKAAGTQFAVNDMTTFLRGRHDACVFPLTGHPPMNIDGWLKAFRIAKDYGLNHVRFHSWCPPEAAFKAADQLGLYLQPELPMWWAFKAEDSSQVAFMLREGRAILDGYGNSPSFTMFALGNEIYQDRAVLKSMVDAFRARDPRHLYAQGSNNFGGNPSFAEGDDYWTTFRTAPEKPDGGTDVRSSISFLDSKDGGLINSKYPSISRTYTEAIALSTVPVIGHEIGQYQIYPNYKEELPKYQGVLKPWNLELFKKRLAEKGMANQAEDFFKATGALSLLCYKEDIETALRTPGFGGFQLLDLMDYPGQGTALVGILDAFMDSKGLILPEDFRRFCGETVIQLNLFKYCWKNYERIRADVQIVNYGPVDLKKPNILISLKGQDLDYSGKIQVWKAPQGGITSAGQVEFDLSKAKLAQKAVIKLSIEDTPISAEYPIWVYPTTQQFTMPRGSRITGRLDSAAFALLKNGGNVLFFPDTSEILDRSVPGQFIPEFWNYGMFTSLAKQWGGRTSPGTLGLFMDPDHPLFGDFPTEFHTNWQWWAIVRNSRPMILDGLTPKYRPLVQVIDNINRNHKLGLIFEFQVQNGKLLVCTAPLLTLLAYPEASQLYASLLKYIGSDWFRPRWDISIEELRALFNVK